MIYQNMRLIISPLHVRKVNLGNQSETQSARVSTVNPAAAKTIDEPSAAQTHVGGVQQESETTREHGVNAEIKL